MTHRFTITGYYGFGNAGDDVILTTIVDRLRGRWPDAPVTVITYPYGDTAAVERMAEVAAVDGRDVQAAAEAIRASDLLLIGGGGLIQDYLPSDPDTHFTAEHGNLSFWATMAMTARTVGTPVATYALGVGPLTSHEGRSHARLVFDQVSLATVRDDRSAMLVHELGVPDDRIVLAADPVFLLEPSGRDPIADMVEADDLPHGGAMRVAVSVRSWGDSDEWQKRMAEALDAVVDRFDADVLFVPFQSSGRGLDNDGLVSTRIAARMRRSERRAVIGADLTPAEKLDVLASSDLVVGMRLHSAVFASAASVPVVAVAYDPKVRKTMEELTLGDLVLEVEDVTVESLVDVVERARSLGPDRIEAYRHARERLAARATRAEEAVAGFLRSPEARPLTEATVAAIGEAAIARAGEVYERAAERDEARIALKETREELDNLRTAYDKLAAQFQAFMDARAVKAVRSLWTLRDRVKGAPAGMKAAAIGAARKVLPPAAKKAIRKVVGTPATTPAPAPELTDAEIERYRTEIADKLAWIVEHHRDAPGFVVFPPGIGWDVELFQRPQQMALAFARLGYPVIYHLEPKHRHGLVGYYTQAEGVYVGYLPERLVDLLHAVPSPIFLSYVYNFDWREHLSDPATVYEHIDDLEVFEHVFRRELLDGWHAHALAEAEVVAASAVSLLNDVKPERPDAVLVPNGVDYGHFASGIEHEVPPDLAELVPDGAPVVGYYGALAEWFDYDLLGAAAQRLPDHHFVLIGPDYDGTAARSEALHRPNVHWLGPRPYADLPAYLARFDVATIPFVVNEVTHAVSPLKLFEYMAGGKPVVTPPLRECSRYRAVQIGEGVDGFVDEIRRAAELGRDTAHVELLRRTARSNTWDARVRTVVEAVERAVAGRDA